MIATSLALLAGAGLVRGSPAWGQGEPGAEPGADRAEQGPSIERFLRIRTPGSATVAPDGTLYVRDWPDGVFQLYRVHGDAARPDTPTTKLTDFPDGLTRFLLSPDGRRVLLLFSAGGNENTQVSLLDPSADGGRGRIVPLLSDPRVRYTVDLWLPDSSGFLYTANDESPSDFHILRFDLADDPFLGAPGSSTRLLSAAGSWTTADATRDGGRLLVGQFRSASDMSLYELEVASGTLRDLTPSPASGGTVAIEPIGYLPGEREALVVCDLEEGAARLFVIDLATGALRKPVPALDRFEIDGALVDRERTLVGITTNEEGFGVPHLYRLPGFEPVALPAAPPGVALLSSLDDRRVVWTLSNAQTPGVAFVAPLGPDGAVGPARQITFPDDQGIDLAAFPLPTLVRFPAFDGREIPAFLMLPPGRRADEQRPTPIPFVVHYHGGPEGQHRPIFSGQLQYLLAQGFGILQPNVRGSSGYGREFLMLDDYTKRWDSVRDGVDAAEWLVRSGWATPGRIATYGGSYGGYMSVATLVEDQRRVQRGERSEALFGAGVNVVGLVNLRTFLEKTAGYRRALREAEYGPLSDPEFLAEVSPMTHIDDIRVPLFIAHGFNDPRVPVEEAMQLAIALKDRGHAPFVFIAPDEGHGFAKLENRLYFGRRMSAFLRQTIGSEKPRG